MKFSQRRKDIAQADQLARALGVDMSDWFEATGETYFNHANRTTIELAVAEAKGNEAELSVRAAKKKGEAVLFAQRHVAGSGWLPAPVRMRWTPQPNHRRGSRRAGFRSSLTAANRSRPLRCDRQLDELCLFRYRRSISK